MNIFKLLIFFSMKSCETYRNIGPSFFSATIGRIQAGRCTTVALDIERWTFNCRWYLVVRHRAHNGSEEIDDTVYICLYNIYIYIYVNIIGKNMCWWRWCQDTMRWTDHQIYLTPISASLRTDCSSLMRPGSILQHCLLDTDSCWRGQTMLMSLTCSHDAILRIQNNHVGIRPSCSNPDLLGQTLFLPIVHCWWCAIANNYCLGARAVLSWRGWFSRPCGDVVVMFVTVVIIVADSCENDGAAPRFASQVAMQLREWHDALRVRTQWFHDLRWQLPSTKLQVIEYSKAFYDCSAREMNNWKLGPT